MANHLTRERGCHPRVVQYGHAYVALPSLPPVLYFYFLAGKLILPSQQPLILMCDLSRIKIVSG